MSTPDARDGRASAHLEHRATLLGALAVALMALAFLWPGIAHFADSVYAPADIAQSYGLTRVEEGYRPRNSNLSDVWVQMHPWMMFNRAEISAGRLPLWNPWNGSGLPHLANFQSAVLSPLSIPYYVLPFELAILVAAFAKLFLFGFGTFLFLRELRLAFAPALFGATAVMFGGQSTIHLALPHSAVACFLPWGLFVLERIARRFEEELAMPAGPRRWFVARHPGLLAAFVLVLAASLLAGHPETFYFVLALLVVYALGRGVLAWSAARRVRGARARLATLGLELLVAGLLAAGLCAIQLNPFFEYLRESQSLHGRSSAVQTPLPIANWPMQAFPNLLGNPANVYFLDFTLPEPDFTTATLDYIGVLALFLALVALVIVRRAREFVLLAGVAIAWFLYAHDVFGFARLLQGIPSVGLAPMNRSQCIWQVSVSACAAFALDRWLRRGSERRLLATAGIVVAGALVFACFCLGAHQLVRETATSQALTGDRLALLRLGSDAHVARIALVFAAGIALLAAISAVRSARIRTACALGLVLLAFAESGALFWSYNPLTPRRLFYPRTPAIAELEKGLDGRDFAILGDDALPPASNSVYGLRQVAAYDALSIRRFDELYVDWFGRGNNWRPMRHASLRALQFFGIECVLDRDGWVDVDTAFAYLEPDQVHYAGAGDLVGGVEVVQELTGVRDGLEALRVRFVRPKRTPACTVEAVLEAADGGRRIASARVAARDLVEEGGGTLALDLVFDRRLDSRSERLRLRLASPDATAAETLVPRMRVKGRELLQDVLQRMQSRWMKKGEEHPDLARWTLRSGGTLLDGHLDLDLAFARSSFVPEREIGPFTLYRIAGATPRFHTVGRALVASSDAEARGLVARQRVDPAREVLLSEVEPASISDAPADPTTEAPVRIDSEIPGHVRLTTRRTRPGWLVLAQPWYPGWTAHVDGAPAPFLRANYAFSAVSIPAGTSVIELDYEPSSVRIGAWISLVSLFAMLFALVLALVHRHSSRKEPG